MRLSLSLQLGIQMPLAGSPPPVISYTSATVYDPDLYPSAFTILYEEPFVDGGTVYDSNTASFANGTEFYLTSTEYTSVFTVTNDLAASATAVVQSISLHDNYLGKSDDVTTYQTVYYASPGYAADIPALGKRLYRNSALTLPVSANASAFIDGYGVVPTSNVGMITSAPARALLTPCYTTHMETTTAYDVYTQFLIRNSVGSRYVYYDASVPNNPVSADFSHQGTYYHVIAGQIDSYTSTVPVVARQVWQASDNSLIALWFPSYDDTIGEGYTMYYDVYGVYTPFADRMFTTVDGGTEAWVTNEAGLVVNHLYEISSVFATCAQNNPISLWSTTMNPMNLPNFGIYNSSGVLYTGTAIHSNTEYTIGAGNVTSSNACPT